MPFPVPAATAARPDVAVRTNESPWQPPVDIVDTDEALVVTLDVPGVAADALRIEAGEHRLRVVGSRKNTLGGRPLASERPHGAFERRFRLRQAIDLDRVTARYAAGVLTIHLPRRHHGETRIPVASS